MLCSVIYSCVTLRCDMLCYVSFVMHLLLYVMPFDAL